MKVKVKLDLKKVQDFLLQNVEKIVLGVVAFVFLLMLYSALSAAGRFNKSPDDLKKQADAGRSAMEATTFADYVKEKAAAAATQPADPAAGGAAPPSPGLAMVDYVAQAKRIQVRIEEKPYTTPVGWDPPPFEPQQRRDEPPLFAVQQLRGATGVGAFSMTIQVPTEGETERTDKTAGKTTDKPAGKTEGKAGLLAGGDRMRGPGGLGMAGGMAGGADSIRGQRWVVLTGLVPIEKQELAYAETFKASPGYTQDDYPMYSAYLVERVEVASADEAANPDWKKAKQFPSIQTVETAMSQWNQSRGGDVVAPEYLDERLTFPLGPLMNRDWDANVAHEPEIPILKGDERGPGQGPGGMMGMGPGGMPGRGMEGMRGGRMPGGGRGAMPGMERGMGPGGLVVGGDAATEGDPFNTNPNAAADKARAAQAENAASTDEKKAPPYKLFRFFDFNVEPGKQYVYRVCLALVNPNYHKGTSLLKKPELAADAFLKTKWSEPSPLITVPRDTRVLMASVKPAHGANDPSGRLLAIRWAKRKGAEIYEEFNVVRGQVANFADVSGKIVGGAAQGQSRTIKASFNSDTTAIDFRGGDSMPGVPGGKKPSSLKAAGECLLLDCDGNLIVRNELDDLPTYDETTAEPEKTGPEAGGLGRGMMPGMGPGMPGRGLESLEGPTKPNRLSR
jgi:hypothetical protein